LNAETLRDRSSEIFPNAYATLLSIVLGIALASVATAVVAALDEPPLELAMSLSEALATVCAVLVVFYSYVWFLLVFRWAPGFLDAVIPLCLGGATAALAAAVGHHTAWLVMLAVLQVIALPSFGHTIHRSWAPMFENGGIRDLTDRILRTSMVTMGVGAAVAAAAAYVAWETGWVWPTFLGAGAALAAGMWLSWREEVALREIYAAHGLVYQPRRNDP